MDLEEARKKLAVTEEERQSLKIYQGFSHTVMNLLGDMEPEIYQELYRAGWQMLGTKEEFKTAVNNFVNLYSLMYKNSRGGQYTDKLIRGTGKKDIERMRSTTNQFLSTSTSEEIAKTFSHYGDDALVRISVGKGVPYTYVEKAENGRDEHEILLAPFCGISKNNRYSQWGGYTYYEMELEKPQLQEVSQDDIDELMGRLSTGFEQNISNMKKFLQYKDEVETLEMRYQRAKGDRQEQQDIQESKIKAKEKRDNLYSVIHEYKMDLRKLLEGLCRQREVEIDKADEIVKEDFRKRREERKRQQEIKEREEAKRKLELAKEKLTRDSNAVISSSTELTGKLDEYYKQLIDKNNAFLSTAQTLQIPYNQIYNLNEIHQTIEEISKSVDEVNNEINNDQKDDKIVTTDSVQESEDSVTQYREGVNAGNNIYDELHGLLNSYVLEANSQIKEEVYKKAMKMISNAKIAQYMSQYQALESQKIGFFGKLFGKEKLRQERLKNIGLRIEGEKIELTPTQEESNNFSVRNTLAELYATIYYEVGDQCNQELRNYYTTVKSIFGFDSPSFSNQIIGQMAEEKIRRNPNRLPIVLDQNESTKTQIGRLQVDNLNLEFFNKQKLGNMRNNFINGYSSRRNVPGEILEKIKEVRKKLTNNNYYRKLHNRPEDLKSRTADIWAQEW